MASNAPQKKFNSEKEIKQYLNGFGFQNITTLQSDVKGKIRDIAVEWKNLEKSDYKQLYANKEYINNLDLEPDLPDEDEDEYSLYPKTEPNMNPSGKLLRKHFSVILKKGDGFYYHIMPQEVTYAADLYYDTQDNINMSQLSLFVTLPPQAGGHRNAFSKSSRRTKHRPSRHRRRRKIKSTLNRSRSSTRIGRLARVAG